MLIVMELPGRNLALPESQVRSGGKSKSRLGLTLGQFQVEQELQSWLDQNYDAWNKYEKAEKASCESADRKPKIVLTDNASGVNGCPP